MAEFILSVLEVLLIIFIGALFGMAFDLAFGTEGQYVMEMGSWTAPQAGSLIAVLFAMLGDVQSSLRKLE